MNFKGIPINVKNKPVLEPNFLPAYKFIEAYLLAAKQPFAFAWESPNGCCKKFDTFIYGSEEQRQLDLFYLSYMIEFAYNSWGGWKLYLCGNSEVAEQLKALYTNKEEPRRICVFAKNYFGRSIAVELLPYESCPEKDVAKTLGRHLDGCRIGFDAGASDWKVSAVVDGQVIYSQETLWNAKFNPDIDYHYSEILKAFKTAAAKLPQVDAIGVSTAGIVVNEQLMATSFFRMVPPDIIAERGRDIYRQIANKIGDDIPLVILNDGLISALAGSMNSGKNKLWGVAIGTNIGTGYVDDKGNLREYLTEIAMVKIAFNEDAAFDESETLQGVGEAYFSQNSVIRSAMAAGVVFDAKQYPAEKLLVVQRLMEADDPKIQQIYENIGCCFAHTLPLVSMFFDIENVYLCGRIVSKKGGELILAECKRVLADEYPDLSKKISIWLPNENDRRVSQSVAAASLPVIS